MQLAFTIKLHHWDYVERQGGIELLTHLREASTRVVFRRAAIERAYEGFAAAEADGRVEAEVGGLGLVVVQRALLAAEDLGGLLHAFRADDPWERLRKSTISDLDAAYGWALATPEEVFSKAFCLADGAVLREEGLTNDVIEPLMDLRRREVARWSRMLENAANLWHSLNGVAKATMHGFPVFAGTYVFDPPGAGEVGEGLRPSPFGRSAIAASSRERDGQVRTARLPVRLDREGVATWARWGKIAALLTGDLCANQAESRMRGYAAAIPLRLLWRLSLQEQELVRATLNRHEDS
ncbi:MAG: hypothetical protein ACR2HC_09760 [Thermoleophilaceae bacterium]